MGKLPRVSGRELIRLLGHFGFVEIRQNGSHVILKKSSPDGELGTVVPDHKELAEGTLRGILRQAKISVEDFLIIYQK